MGPFPHWRKPLWTAARPAWRRQCFLPLPSSRGRLRTLPHHVQSAGSYQHFWTQSLDSGTAIQIRQGLNLRSSNTARHPTTINARTKAHLQCRQLFSEDVASGTARAQSLRAKGRCQALEPVASGSMQMHIGSWISSAGSSIICDIARRKLEWPCRDCQLMHDVKVLHALSVSHFSLRQHHQVGGSLQDQCAGCSASTEVALAPRNH